MVDKGLDLNRLLGAELLGLGHLLRSKLLDLCRLLRSKLCWSDCWLDRLLLQERRLLLLLLLLSRQRLSPDSLLEGEL